ncbi:hypothetical protein C7B61_04600 [filamentous cyanobacterium CCP1]|nr:hypothetical protein C7B76_14715 [filamentous cyanobacterium CCP2]PSB67736.1 hypothetical protein C7B61_04600 [filamentous cyanobacterium CCP1]
MGGIRVFWFEVLVLNKKISCNLWEINFFEPGFAIGLFASLPIFRFQQPEFVLITPAIFEKAFL